MDLLEDHIGKIYLYQCQIFRFVYLEVLIESRKIRNGNQIGRGKERLYEMGEIVEHWLYKGEWKKEFEVRTRLEAWVKYQSGVFSQCLKNPYKTLLYKSPIHIKEFN